MKEIGGYIELDTYHLPIIHEEAIALNCGRNALAFLLKAREIKKLWIPKLICNSVTGVCDREGIPYGFYSIGINFLPIEHIDMKEGEWFYFVNYYSQFDNEIIAKYVSQYKRVIVDHAQSFFQEPIPGVDNLYTCRKYFGVPDGAFLYTDAYLDDKLPEDESFERMHFLLGRFERNASDYYNEYVANNDFFMKEPIKTMSKLTKNLLHGIDYEQVKKRREENFLYLHNMLGEINQLRLNKQPGTFMYPLMISNGAEIRRSMQEKKIYVPTLWSDVFNWCEKSEIEYYMAENILPLPIDQRYGAEDMKTIVETFNSVNREKGKQINEC